MNYVNVHGQTHIRDSRVHDTLTGHCRLKCGVATRLTVLNLNSAVSNSVLCAFRYGLECLFRYYSYGLEKRFRLEVYKDFQVETMKDHDGGK